MSLFKLLCFLFPLFVLARPPANSQLSTMVIEITTATTTTTVTTGASDSPSLSVVIQPSLSISLSSTVASHTEPPRENQAAVPKITPSTVSEATSRESSALTSTASIEIVVPSRSVLSSAPSVSSSAVSESVLPDEENNQPPDVFTGDVTFYDVGDGLGSCGEQSDETEMVVALSSAMMANRGNPNKNPKCFTYITLYRPETKEPMQGKVVSTCPGCSEYDVDLSPALFRKITPNGDGRVSGIAWHWS